MTSTVTGTLVNPAAGALTGALVSFTLVDYSDRPVIGFNQAALSETVDTVTVVPSVSGAWTAQLVPNDSVQLSDGAATTAYRVVETSAGASSTYWIVVTAVSPAWVGTLRTALVGSAGAVPVAPGTWCALSAVPSYTGLSTATAETLAAAQGMLEALIHRVWRATDEAQRDFYWLTRATAWQAVYIAAHPELLTMMDVQSISQDGLSITFRSSSTPLAMYSPIGMRFLSSLFRGSNTTIRFNSAFQKNRPGSYSGASAGGSAPWRDL